MLSKRSALIVAIAVAAGLIGWVASASHSRAAQMARAPWADNDSANWLAEAPPPRGDGERPDPPPPPGRAWDGRRDGWGGPRVGGPDGGGMRPMAEAGAKIRLMKEHLDLVWDLRRVVGDPLESSIVAIHGIVELGKDNSKQAISSLESLLDQTEVLPLRTAIHFGLKEVMEKSGDKEGAIKQLQAIVAETAKAVGSAEMRGGGRPGPGDRGGREGQAPRGPRQPEQPQPGQ